MTVAALPYNHMFFDISFFDLLYWMTGEAIAAALSHRIGVGSVTVDAGQHRLVTFIFIDRRNEIGMAGQTITGTRKYSEREE